MVRSCGLILTGDKMADGHTRIARSYEFTIDDEDLTVYRTSPEGGYAHVGAPLRDLAEVRESMKRGWQFPCLPVGFLSEALQHLLAGEERERLEGLSGCGYNGGRHRRKNRGGKGGGTRIFCNEENSVLAPITGMCIRFRKGESQRSVVFGKIFCCKFPSYRL